MSYYIISLILVLQRKFMVNTNDIFYVSHYVYILSKNTVLFCDQITYYVLKTRKCDKPHAALSSRSKSAGDSRLRRFFHRVILSLSKSECNEDRMARSAVRDLGGKSSTPFRALRSQKCAQNDTGRRSRTDLARPALRNFL